MTHQDSDILLLGAGHCHLQLLAELIKIIKNKKGLKKPGNVQKDSNACRNHDLPLTKLVLVDYKKSVWYSGLISGFLYGEIDQEMMEIDLPHLFAQLNRNAAIINMEFIFIQAEVISWNLDSKRVRCSDGIELTAKALSVNLGAPIRNLQTPKDWTKCIHLGAKPFETLVNTLIDIPPSTLVVVGGGASGVELILGIQHFLTKFHPQGAWKYSLVVSQGPLVDWPRSSRSKICSLIKKRGIELLDELPTTPPGVLINATGFYQPEPLEVDTLLRVFGYSKVYGSGDGISVCGLDPVYGGVFPVQQGALLLETFMEDRVLVLPDSCSKSFRSNIWTLFKSTKDAKQIVQQTSRLQIINLGPSPYAQGRWKGFALHGWIWKKIKNRIDLAFMDQFYLDS